MVDEAEPNKALTVMMSALNWAYDQAASAIPGLGSAEDLAASHLKSAGGSVEKAIDDLIIWQTGYAGAAGFATNLGGIITMPVAVPANLASVLLIQLRMIAAVAHLRGYDIADPRVRTVAFLCLTGSGSASILQEFGVSLGTKLTAKMIANISGATLTKINQAVGFRLITKAGSTGLVNLTKLVPFIGGVIGGGFDAAMTRGVGEVTKRNFPQLEHEEEGEVIDAAVVEVSPGEEAEAVTQTAGEPAIVDVADAQA